MERNNISSDWIRSATLALRFPFSLVALASLSCSVSWSSSPSDYSSKDAASTAYARVCAPYHSWSVRTAVAAGMYTLPTRQQLLLKLHATNHSAEKKMKRYISASLPVIEYIDKLYLSRNIRLDW